MVSVCFDSLRASPTCIVRSVRLDAPAVAAAFPLRRCFCWCSRCWEGAR